MDHNARRIAACATPLAAGGVCEYSDTGEAVTRHLHHGRIDIETTGTLPVVMHTTGTRQRDLLSGTHIRRCSSNRHRIVFHSEVEAGACGHALHALAAHIQHHALLWRERDAWADAEEMLRIAAHVAVPHPVVAIGERAAAGAKGDTISPAHEVRRRLGRIGAPIARVRWPWRSSASAWAVHTAGADPFAWR